MKIKIFIFLQFFVLFLGAQSSVPILPEWSQEEYNAANTAINATYLNAQEKDMILLNNLVRINPQKFSRTYLENYLKENEEERNNYYTTSLQQTLSTIESMSPLRPSKKLSACSAFHAEDMGKTGMIGHDDSDGTSMEKRFYRFIPKEKFKALSENCQYGFKEPMKIFMDLLIDEGIENLGHRNNLLDSEMEFTGVAIRPHSKYRVNFVQDFGAVMK